MDAIDTAANIARSGVPLEMIKTKMAIQKKTWICLTRTTNAEEEAGAGEKAPVVY